MPKKTKIFVSFTVLLSIALAVGLAELFSSILTISDFAFINTSQNKISGFNIYAVSTAKTTNKENVQTLSKENQNKNGAGYVYEKDGLFYILASAYESENDAIKVCENLKNQDIECEIIVITVDDIKLDLSLSGQEKVAFNNCFTIFKSCYQKLYDLSVSIDTSVKNQTECKLEISNLKSDLTKVVSDFETHFNSKLTQDLVFLKLQLDDLDELLESLYQDNQSQLTSFSSVLKCSYIKVVMMNIDICKQFN